jgi:hypothetical protein
MHFQVHFEGDYWQKLCREYSGIPGFLCKLIATIIFVYLHEIYRTNIYSILEQFYLIFYIVITVLHSILPSLT